MRTAFALLCICLGVGLLVLITQELGDLSVAAVRRPVPIPLPERGVGPPPSAHEQPVTPPPIARRPPVTPAPAVRDAPSEPAPPSGTPLDAPSPDDPIIVIRPPGPKRDSTGTAFPVRKSGWFLTARHVVNGCDRVGIVTGKRRVTIVSRIALSARADLALMRTRYFPLPLAFERPDLHYGQSGFGYGFPKGKWGQVHGLLLGRARSQRSDRTGPLEETLVWSVSNMPEPGLGGMSGGPMLGASGTVIGVHSSSSIRRGRLNTVAPISISLLLAKHALEEDDSPAPALDLSGLDTGRYVKVGEQLRTRGRVVRVLCDVAEDDGTAGG